MVEIQIVKEGITHFQTEAIVNAANFYDAWYDDFDGFDDAEMYWDDYH